MGIGGSGRHIHTVICSVVGGCFFPKHVTRGLQGKEGGSVFVFVDTTPGVFNPGAKNKQYTHTCIHTLPYATHIRKDKVDEQQHKRDRGGGEKRRRRKRRRARGDTWPVPKVLSPTKQTKGCAQKGVSGAAAYAAKILPSMDSFLALKSMAW